MITANERDPSDSSHASQRPESGRASVPSSPGTLPEISLADIGIHALSESECLEHVFASLERSRGGWLLFPNLDHLRLARKERELRDLFEGADLRLANSRTLLWACKLQRTPVPGRVASARLVLFLCDRAAQTGRSVFLLGGNPGTAESVRAQLEERSPSLRIVGTYCPPMGFEKDALEMARISRRIDETEPDLVFVALSSPKQEQTIAHLRHDRPEAWWVGVGHVFSLLAGELKPAPAWMESVGLDWTHRLCQEPGRLFKRYAANSLRASWLLTRCGVRGVLPRGKRVGRYGRAMPRALIVDDDSFALDHLELLLSSRFPALEIETRTEPDIEGRFDFYFLDNQFENQFLAADLAARIRARNPLATIVTFSGALDVTALKRLINAGCDGVCEKGNPKSLRPILDLVETRLEEIEGRHGEDVSFGGVRRAARSITELLRDWNAEFERPDPVKPAASGVASGPDKRAAEGAES